MTQPTPTTHLRQGLDRIGDLVAARAPRPAFEAVAAQLRRAQLEHLGDHRLGILAAYATAVARVIEGDDSHMPAADRFMAQLRQLTDDARQRLRE